MLYIQYDQYSKNYDNRYTLLAAAHLVYPVQTGAGAR